MINDPPKGIILAGGAGTRLYPATKVVSKQLLPVYDKPMIYYPLSTLMLAGIRDILVASKPEDTPRFQQLLQYGQQCCMNISYAIQPRPEGIAQAFLIGAFFIGNRRPALILGDNIFFGHNLVTLLKQATQKTSGATIFGYHVQSPERYGVIELDSAQRPLRIEEKPKNPKSNYAVTGLYFYDEHVVQMAKGLKPSARGELEITDLNKLYLEEGNLHVQIMGRGFTWLDAGTHDSLLEAGNFVATLQKRQGMVLGCPEEIAFHQGWINKDQLQDMAKKSSNNAYGQYLYGLIK